MEGVTTTLPVQWSAESRMFVLKIRRRLIIHNLMHLQNAPEYFGSIHQDESNNIPPTTKNFSGIPLVSTEITHELVMDELSTLNDVAIYNKSVAFCNN